MLHDRLDGQRAGDFAMRFAAHTVGEDEQVQLRDNTEAVLIVRTDAPHAGHAAADNLH